MKKQFRVYLRALEPEDYKISVRWRKDDEIWRTVVGPKHFVSAAYEKKWVEDTIFNPGNKLILGVCLKETDELIGFVHLINIDHKNKSAASGKLIGEKEHWSKGYGAEATLQILYHAFMVLGLHRVESRQITGHQAAIRSIEKIGYQQEGVLRKAVFKHGRYQDVNIMSILKEDFEPYLKEYEWEYIPG